MSKKKGLNIKVIAPIASVAVLGALVGSYFIGYNVGKNNSIQGGATPVNADTIAPVTVDYSDPYSNIVGVFQRSFYNNYNKSVESYAVFREDKTCYYIESVSTEASARVNFDDRSQQCTYTFDETTRSGIISIAYSSSHPENTTDYKFTFEGSLRIGAASYGRIK